MYLLHSNESGKVNHIIRLNRIICSIYSASGDTNVTVTHMIRFSIYFLVFFTVSLPAQLWGQDKIEFRCYNLDSISWTLDVMGCDDPQIDSFQIITRNEPTSNFDIRFTSNMPTQLGYRNESLKTHDAIVVRYFIKCPDSRVVSDTLILTALREPVLLDSVRVLDNGNVELSWQNKPIKGVRYVVNAAVGGSSQVLTTDLRESRYTDTRGLAGHNVEYYSISAALDCGYTFPEPDSFFHTSFLSMTTTPCEGAISFDFIPYAYWNEGTSSTTLFVASDGEVLDSVDLQVGARTFTYENIENDRTYTFFVREMGSASAHQVAYSNPITYHSDFYQTIQWITIDDFSFDESNQAKVSWRTNERILDSLFVLIRNQDALTIPESDLIVHPEPHRYGLDLEEFPAEGSNYQISLLDSCGTEVVSLTKKPFLTRGQLTSNNQLGIQWTDVGDDEWTMDRYEIYTRTDGAYTLLGSEIGNSFNFSHSFEPGASIDSVCYYVIGHGEVQLPDRTVPLRLRSNTVCLFGETVVEIPNAHSSHQPPYKPIVVPKSNLTSYVFRVYDRYGSLVFETQDPEQGWDGQYRDRSGFSDVFVIQVEITNTQGESIQKTGSLILFP